MCFVAEFKWYPKNYCPSPSTTIHIFSLSMRKLEGAGLWLSIVEVLIVYLNNVSICLS